MLWGFFLLMLLPLTGKAQDNRLINTRSWHYEYIQRLQQRGHLLELNPTDLPYTAGDIRKALENMDQTGLSDRELRWHRMLAQSVVDKPPNVDGMRVGGVIEGQLRHSSSERLNVLRPLGRGKPVLPRASLTGYLEWEKWIGQMGATFDWFYDLDPDGLDTGDRLYMRSENGYFGYNGDYIKVNVGRYKNHWSEYDHRGVFLTDNPQAFDHIQLKFGTSRLSFSSIFGELDNMSSDSTFTGFSHELGATRRYLFMHRIDWSPSPQLKLTFLEGETYFSPTSSISMKNLLPLQFLFFESSNAPRNNDVNLGVGGSVWLQIKPITFYIQGMLDDIDIKYGGEESDVIPTIYSVVSSVSITDIAKKFDFRIEADMVSVNSYRSETYEQQWTYVQRGLATNFSDYMRTKFSATFYPGIMEDLLVEPGLTFYWKGEGDLRDLRTSTNPNGSRIPGILSGTVERTVRPSLYLRYQPIGSIQALSEGVQFSFWMDADMGVNFIQNENNMEGIHSEKFVGLLRMSGRIHF